MAKTNKDLITRICDRIFAVDNPEGTWEKIGKEKLEVYKRTGVSDLEVESQTVYYKLITYDVLRLLSAEGFPRRKLPGLRIMEAGCGTGLLTISLARLGAHGWLLDKSPYWYKYARVLGERASRSGGFKGKLDYVQEDFLSRSFLQKYDGFFDLVHNEGVLEHYTVEEAAPVIRSLATLARKGGKVMIAVPNFFSPDMIAIWMKYGKLDERFYSRSMLKRALEDAGLKDVRIMTTSLAFPHWVKSPLIRNMPFAVERFIGHTLQFGFHHVGIGTRD